MTNNDTNHTTLAKRPPERVMVSQPQDISTLPAGHPLQLMQQENEALKGILADIESAANREDAQASLQNLQRLYGLWNHYNKKDGIIAPMLYRYGVTGPSQVMWNVDDEIKDELSAVCRPIQQDIENFPIYRGRIYGLTQRAEEMIRKEEQIVMPMTLRFFTDEQWYAIYGDFKESGTAFDVPFIEWPEAESWLEKQETALDTDTVINGKVRLSTGEVTLRQLRGIFALLPIDITFIDETDTIRFFLNEGHIFDRPKTCLGRPVYDCHPPRIIPVVKNLIEDFRAKRRDHMTVARRIKGKPVLVKYMGVYDENDAYIGTVEFVQDCSDILASFKG